MPKIKLPTHLYVTVKEDVEWVKYEDSRDYRDYVMSTLGFLHSYNPKKGFEKKHSTQDIWAYDTRFDGDDIITPTLERDVAPNGEFFLRGSVRQHRPTADGKWGGWEHYPITPDLDERIRPRVWENIPMRGFKILEFVTRSTTANKLWRVRDPRGVIFEISTAALEKIILETTIVKGEIQAECQWVGNTNLIVCNQ